MAGLEPFLSFGNRIAEMAPLISKMAFQDFLAIPRSDNPGGAVTENADYHLVHDSIRDALKCQGGGLHRETLHYFWKLLEIAVHMERAPEEAWQLLAIVRDACGDETSIAAFSDKAAWTKAFEHASVLVPRGVHKLFANSRESVVAASLKFFEKRGYGVEIDGLGARLDPKSFKKICAKIEQYISFAGGRFSADLLLAAMKGTGCIIDGSLISARTPVQVCQRSEARTPLHYLYNIALKYFRTEGRGVRRREAFVKAELLARHLAATLDLETHSIFENTSLPNRFFEKVLRETVLYDELFGFPQWQPESSRKLTKMYIEALERAGCKLPEATASEWIAIASGLHTMAHPSQLSTFSRERFQANLPSHAAAARLTDLLAIPEQNLNSKYRWPTDTTKRLDAGYPIIKARNGDYISQPTAIGSRAFIERLLDLMRQAELQNATGEQELIKARARLESRFGKALEYLTANALRDVGANVTFEGAEYWGKNKNQRLEIDAVVETDTDIFLFECKKKVLTASARQGESLAMLTDLADSFLKMQSQLARHEAKLRKYGKIDFLDGRTLELRGRNIEKFAISLFDHGALQGRSFTVPLFANLFGSTISAEVAVADKVTSTINEQLVILTESAKAICAAQPESRERDALHGFAMSTWWLSVDQLHYLCRSGSGLSESLQDLRHFESRSGDIIWDAYRVKNLGPVAKALLEAAQKMNSRALI
jgi:hypothetical protein